MNENTQNEFHHEIEAIFQKYKVKQHIVVYETGKEGEAAMLVECGLSFMAYTYKKLKEFLKEKMDL